MAVKYFMRAFFGLLLAALLVAGADARFPRGGSASSGFNGGRAQTNLSAVTISGAYEFLNTLKNAQQWAWNDNTNSPVTPDTLNDDGYPTTILHTGIKTSYFVPSQQDRPGNYVVDWTDAGTGTIILGMSNTVLPSATFTGSVTAGVLTAGAPTGGTIQKGMELTGTGVTARTIIGAQLTGSAGLAGTYSVVGSTSVASTSMGVNGGSKTGGGGSGRYVFSTTAGGAQGFVVGIGSTGISNMRVYHVDDEALLNAGEVFSAKFKAKIREGKFGVIRSLNWLSSNTTNMTTWATRKPTTHVFYGGYQLRNSLYATSATSLTAQAYSVTGPVGFTLTDKAMVHVLIGQSYPGILTTFTNGSANVGIPSHGLSINSRLQFSVDIAGTAGTPGANFALNTDYYVVSVPNSNTVTLSATQGGGAITAGSAGSGSVYANPAITLNVSGTGAIDIVSEDCRFPAEANGARPVAGTYQSLATFVYDAGLNKYIKYGGDIGYASVGIDNAVPPELFVRLAYEVGAHPWVNVPYLALDPMTDWAPEYINYVKNYPSGSWMIPRVEPTNELFNTAGGFFPTGYANVKAVANWGSGTYLDWAGKVTSTLGQTAANIYGGTGGLGTTYQVVIAVQTVNTGGSNERATASKYVAQAAAAQSLVWSGGTINFTKSAASGWTSHVAPATYISPSEYGSGTEATRATAFGGVRFTASITAGAMTVTGIDTSGGALAIGMTVFGRGIANNALQSGVTITSGSAPNWTLSSAITLTSDTFYAGVDMTQPGLYVDSLGGAASGFNLAQTNSYYTSWKAWGAGFGINKMTAYEGQYSPDCTSGCRSAVDILRLAGSLVASSPGSATGLQGYTYGNATSNFQNFLNAGGEFPSNYLMTGVYPADIIWPVLHDIYQPDPPQWNAFKAFNFLLKRDLDPASNDNDPAWLEKVA